MIVYTAYYPSAIGSIRLTMQNDALLSCTFVEVTDVQEGAPNHPFLTRCMTQLHEYFNGQRRVFTMPLNPKGTAFAQQVWQQLVRIPFATTVSYRDVATAVGNPKAARAVGRANHANPIAIIIPCHRVIGSQGALTGYADGIWRKAWLLEHEARQLPTM